MWQASVRTSGEYAEVWSQDSLQVEHDSSHKSERQVARSESFLCCVPHSLQLWEGIHLETRLLKEPQDACKKGMTERSAIAKHAWNEHHHIMWEEVTIVDQARRKKELELKEALHIQLKEEEQRFNRKLPGCRVTTARSMTEKPHTSPS